jgi:predicted molibdopterin-dependent oxidoreductase YjgC
VEGERNHFVTDDLSPLWCGNLTSVYAAAAVSVSVKTISAYIYRMVERSFQSIVGPAYNGSLMESPCIYCGQCITVCPTSALREKDSTARVWEAG